MIIIRPDEFLIKLLDSQLVYSYRTCKWNGYIVDHEGRDYLSPITDIDRLVTVYILMRRFKRRCYASRFNVAIALGMSYKLTPQRALTLPLKQLMNTMRKFSLRSRCHYYSRFELAGLDPRDFRWPQYLSHNHVNLPYIEDGKQEPIARLHSDMMAWIRNNMA